LRSLFRPVSGLSQDVAEDRVPQADKTVQNVNSRSRKIAVNAAISPHSVAVKPFSSSAVDERSRTSLASITGSFGETENGL